MRERRSLPPLTGRVGRRAFFVGLAATGTAAALGRTPYGGRLTLKVPWGVRALDPHQLDDPAAALFGAAMSDPLYALDSKGRPYPTLATALPEATGRGARVRLRPHLNTARGRALDARDLLWSLKRSRLRGGVSVLSPFREPQSVPGDGLAILFPGADPKALARALSSPVTALLPRSFSSQKPDATGAFQAQVTRDRLVLTRNLRAARGAAFLSRIEVRRASDLADALRSFETGDVDIGWLGRGLHRPRPGSKPFDAGRLGWVVLRTGRDAGDWGAPGVAQRLLDGIGRSRLAHLGLHAVPAAQGSPRWGGAPCDLLVPDDSPHLIQIARTLAGHLGQPGHEVRVAPRPRGQVRRAAASARFSLQADFVRQLGPTDEHTLLALLTAADPALARRPPRLTTTDPRRMTQTLPLGVVGELRIEGAHLPAYHALPAWDLGAVWRE